MKGQIDLFENEQYRYWECIGKKQPKDIETPKCIKISLSTNHCSWHCPTCKGEDDIHDKHSNLLDRCSWCGQRIYFSDEEIEAQPYYQAMVKRKNIAIAKDKSSIYQKTKKELDDMLKNGIISKDRYLLLLEKASASMIHDRKRVEEIEFQILREDRIVEQFNKVN